METDGFAIDTQIDGSTVTVRVSGELDAATAPEVDEAIRQASSDSTSLVVVDFSGLGFIDSSGLSVLVSAHKRLTKAGATLQVRAASPSVARVFAIAGLDKVLTITE